MARVRKYYFTPYVVTKGRKTDEFKPYAKIGKAGAMTIGKESLEKLELDKTMFYRMYVDRGHRTIGLAFTNQIKLEADGWKTWQPKNYNRVKLVQVGVGSFLRELEDVLLPSKRLPIKKYIDTDVQQEFYYVEIPRGAADPNGRKFDPNNDDQS